MGITIRLFIVSLMVLAAIGMTTEAEAFEPDEPSQTSSTNEPNGESELVNDLETEAECQRWDGGTIGWQGLGGLTLGLAGFFMGIPIGGAIGSATSDCSDRDFGCIGHAILGGFVGATLGSSAGVQLAGVLSGGDGHYMGTLGGSLGGFGIGLLMIGLVRNSDSGVLLAIPAGALMTVGGGILGYHLTASAEISGVSIAPTDGGASVGITGRF